MTADRLKQIEPPKSWNDLQPLQFFIKGGEAIVRDENGRVQVMEISRLGNMAERLGLALDFSK